MQKFTGEKDGEYFINGYELQKTDDGLLMWLDYHSLSANLEIYSCWFSHITRFLAGDFSKELHLVVQGELGRKFFMRVEAVNGALECVVNSFDDAYVLENHMESFMRHAPKKAGLEIAIHNHGLFHDPIDSQGIIKIMEKFGFTHTGTDSNWYDILYFKRMALKTAA